MSNTNTQLQFQAPTKNVLTFDPDICHCSSLVEPDKETLEAGLRRELLEEMGVELPVSAADHVSSSHAPASPHPSNLILHFYVKKTDEQQILAVERAAATVASDHGNEVAPPLSSG